MPPIETTFNSSYWKLYKDASGNLHIEVQSGKTASAAIADIFANQSKYVMACWLGAASAVLNGAASAYPGSGGFDNGMGLNPYGNYPKAIEWAIVPNPTGNNDPNNAKWMPGDWGYIDNTAYYSGSGYIQGENVIYLGGCFSAPDKPFSDFKNNADFWGHGGGTMKLGTWMQKVEQWSPGTNMKISGHRARLWLQ
jgi:hypothetical protein